MKFQRLTFMILLFVLPYASCTDALDMAPDGNMQMDEVLSDPEKVEALLNTCYQNIPQKGYAYWFFEEAVVAATDDAWTSDEAQGVITTAALSMSSMN
ncbi:MAG: hypothetical protein EAS52_06580 [Parapedobacter sp.]|nr:MAG: hypothetical protein EAS52_06580 [Parapedobacter sp.]